MTDCPASRQDVEEFQAWGKAGCYLCGGEAEEHRERSPAEVLQEGAITHRPTEEEMWLGVDPPLPRPSQESWERARLGYRIVPDWETMAYKLAKTPDTQGTVPEP